MRKRFIASGVAGVAAAGILTAAFWPSSGSGAAHTGPPVAPVKPASASSPDHIGPLGGGPVDGTMCTPAPHAVSVAMDVLRNPTTTPIQLERFTLVGARGVRLVGVSLAPLVAAAGGGGDTLTVGGAYPPSPADLAASADVHWNARHSLPMTMPPDGPGQSWDLVVGLERTAAAGSVSYYQIQYEWNGQQYTWSGQNAIRLIAGSSCS